ncbi:MAG TPA: hypothetical protein VFL86_11340 [Burkholderiaceae bacterium]|nr:hypothetical protein [Burkholderiaceae bacterium]
MSHPFGQRTARQEPKPVESQPAADPATLSRKAREDVEARIELKEKLNAARKHEQFWNSELKKERPETAELSAAASLAAQARGARVAAEKAYWQVEHKTDRLDPDSEETTLASLRQRLEQARSLEAYWVHGAGDTPSPAADPVTLSRMARQAVEDRIEMKNMLEAARQHEAACLAELRQQPLGISCRSPVVQASLQATEVRKAAEKRFVQAEHKKDRLDPGERETTLEELQARLETARSTEALWTAVARDDAHDDMPHTNPAHLSSGQEIVPYTGPTQTEAPLTTAPPGSPPRQQIHASSSRPLAQRLSGGELPRSGRLSLPSTPGSQGSPSSPSSSVMRSDSGRSDGFASDRVTRDRQRIERDLPAHGRGMPSTHGDMPDTNPALLSSGQEIVPYTGPTQTEAPLTTAPPRSPPRRQIHASSSRPLEQRLSASELPRSGRLSLPSTPTTPGSPSSSPSSVMHSDAGRQDRFTSDWVTQALQHTERDLQAHGRRLEVPLHAPPNNEPPNNEPRHDEPPPGRSWRATLTSMLDPIADAAAAAAGRANTVMNNAYGGVSRAAAVARDTALAVGGEIKSHGQSLGLMLPSGRLAGAMAGHVIHQSAAVGVPTFLREMLAEGLVLGMRHMPPDQVAAMQAGVGLASFGLQMLRRRLENRYPDDAARGFHALSQQQWNRLSDERKAELRHQQQRHSRMVTDLQVVASITNTMVSLAAARSGDPSQAEVPARILATDLKATMYAAMRDMIQATFSMVGTAAPTTGVSGSHMLSSASFFSFMSMVTDYAFTHFPGQVPDASQASKMLRGALPPNTHMTLSDAWMTRAEVALVKAAINTTLHASDWIYMTQEEANQANTTQHWAPSSNALNPARRDYARILDHVPTRMTLLGGGNSTSNLIGFLMRDNAAWKSALAGNVADAVYQGFVYKTIVGTWQAQAEVRAAARAAARAEVERDHVGEDLERAIVRRVLGVQSERLPHDWMIHELAQPEMTPAREGATTRPRSL